MNEDERAEEDTIIDHLRAAFGAFCNEHKDMIANNITIASNAWHAAIEWADTHCRECGNRCDGRSSRSCWKCAFKE